jgi:dTDP-4-dehydrorhamnose reductase
MVIAVTGSKGTIGSELVRRGCIPILNDITNHGDIFYEISKMKPNVVIHCAAITDVGYCEDNFKESFEVNVKGTANVVGAMPKDSLFVYLSSDHVFEGNNWFSQGYGEWQKPNPINRYGFSKWGGELTLKTGNCHTLIVRGSKCFNYAWAKPTIDALKNGETVVFTDLIKRSFVHVQHFVDGLLYAVEHYKEIEGGLINISGDSVFSYYGFWSIVKKVLNLPGEIIPRRERLDNECPRPFRAGLDVHWARSLGVPIYGINEGIKLLEKGI